MQNEQGPPTLISVKVEPKKAADKARLAAALHDMACNDPKLSFAVDPESGESTINGADELHLEGVIEAVIARGIGLNVGPQQIEYRETLSRAAEIDYTHDKRRADNRQFARVKLHLAPNNSGWGNVFDRGLVSGVLAEEIIEGIRKGVNAVWRQGVLIGFPLVDMRVTVLEGTTLEGGSSGSAFEIAAREAVKNGCATAGVKLREPIMTLDVVAPAECSVRIVANIDSRRGKLLSRTDRGDATTFRAHVPLANLFGIASELGLLTEGRATYALAFSHYLDVPKNVTPDPRNFPPAVGMRA